MSTEKENPLHGNVFGKVITINIGESIDTHFETLRELALLNNLCAEDTEAQEYLNKRRTFLELIAKTSEALILSWVEEEDQRKELKNILGEALKEYEKAVLENMEGKVNGKYHIKPKNNEEEIAKSE